MNDLTKRIKMIVSCLNYFSHYSGMVELRPYQVLAASAVVESVLNEEGKSFVWMFSRQSGKDEAIMQLISYLLAIFGHRDESIVIVNPTFKPQTEKAMMRMENRLDRNLITRKKWQKRSGYIFSYGQAKATFFSGDPAANVVGETASLLLIINEAQDILPAIYDKRFAPMRAAYNATCLMCGTAWTSESLLERERRQAAEAELRDGRKYVYLVDADEVGLCHPPYAEFVGKEIARLGRQHPLIRTQYFNETIDAQAGMFNPGRRALMQGDREGYACPKPGHVYGFLVDVAGQDEARMALDDDAPLSNPGRDAVSLTIVEIGLDSIETLQAPTYRAVYRQQWIGLNHLTVFGALKSLGEAWQPLYLAIDASGVGEGLWAMLDRAFPARVQAVKFTQQEKSEIGWRFLAIIETGRFRDCCQTDQVRAQYDACKSEILPGPAKTLRWGVPDGTRGQDGELLHDDIIISDSLVSILDRLEWTYQFEAYQIPGEDPLTGMDRNF